MKNPFDLARDLATKKSKWSDEISGAWNTYMVNRALSMNEDYVEIVDFVQRYYNIPEESIHEIFRTLLPKNYTYPKYIKAEGNFSKDLKVVQEYFEVSKKEARDILKVLTPEKLKEIKETSLEDFTTSKIKQDAKPRRNKSNS